MGTQGGGGGPATVSCQVEPTQVVEPMPTDGFAPGSQAYAPS